MESELAVPKGFGDWLHGTRCLIRNEAMDWAYSDLDYNWFSNVRTQLGMEIEFMSTYYDHNEAGFICDVLTPEYNP
jgi:hypothetical protein